MEPFAALPSGDPPTTAGRLPWPTPEELDPPRREVYDRIVSGPRGGDARRIPLTDDHGRLYGPFNAILVAPGVGDPTQSLGAAIRYRSELSDRCRELAILVVAAAHHSEVEWCSHEEIALGLDLDPGVLEQIRTQAPLGDGLADDEHVVVETTRRLVADRDLDDDRYRRAQDALGYEGLAELLTLVGYYELLARQLRVWRTPLPPGATPVFDADGPYRPTK